uniref:Alcohol dehydrogenase-like N-terminal domain-containing protein n=1 Tax=Sinocyclocheilus grahami TaxID=75366 RepID=A0A672MYV6_SINGR
MSYLLFLMNLMHHLAWEAEKALSIEEVEVAPPNIFSFQIVAFVVRHSDWIYLYDVAKTKPWSFPLILGDEGAGIVESVVPGVTKVSKGKPKKSIINTFNLLTSNKI